MNVIYSKWTYGEEKSPVPGRENERRITVVTWDSVQSAQRGAPGYYDGETQRVLEIDVTTHPALAADVFRNAGAYYVNSAGELVKDNAWREDVPMPMPAPDPSRVRPETVVVIASDLTPAEAALLASILKAPLPGVALIIRGPYAPYVYTGAEPSADGDATVVAAIAAGNQAALEGLKSKGLVAAGPVPILDYVLTDLGAAVAAWLQKAP